MIQSVENKFVDTFIIKPMRERMKFELSNEKKRWKGIDRLCPATLDIIISKYVILNERKITIEDIKKFLSKLIKLPKIVYYMDQDEGDYISIDKAFEFCEVSHFPVVIILNEELVYLQTEWEYGGGPQKCILRKQ